MWELMVRDRLAPNGPSVFAAGEGNPPSADKVACMAVPCAPPDAVQRRFCWAAVPTSRAVLTSDLTALTLGLPPSFGESDVPPNSHDTAS